ncbi:MAG: hypothetical protein H6738_11700 [Alphaproteobacteria bacterium]|nr:hypothetical protein [Alphaproteobacteria bacterium]MCB9697436.1 hypothetical protein [Alphaproteobacteria bacterium]
MDRILVTVSLLVALPLACDPAVAPIPGQPEDGVPVGTVSLSPDRVLHRLTDVELLTRISLDLRGVRPTPEEMDAVLADPSVLDDMIDAFLLDVRFERRLEDLWSEILHTRNGDWHVRFDVYADPLYGGWTEEKMVGHIGEEPLRMLSYLAANDLPYSDWVTGDWTMANVFLGNLFPVTYPENTKGWKRVSYTDHRPPVGVLATNGLWWFEGSMENNRNRGRANYVSRVFLCDDYLEHEVVFTEVPGDSEAALGDAIDTDPACRSCHQTLDPIASHFYGFWWYYHDRGLPEMIEEYHPEREPLWRDLTGIPPGFHGQDSRGLVDLGRLVSEHPAFAPCFVEHAWETTTRTDVDEAPVDLSGIEQVFVDSGLRIRDVFRALVHHPAYRGDDARFALKMATPELLTSQVEGLTGFVWERAGRDLVNSAQGYSLLAGGSDGDVVTSPPPTSNVTTLLVQQRLAENAAAHVVQADRALTSGRLLFRDDLTFEETPDSGDDQRVRAQMVDLELRILGERLDPNTPEIDELMDLWALAWSLSERDPVEASWSAVVGVLLRDPDLVMY